MAKKSLFLIGLIFVSLGIIIYSYRWIFYQTFIPRYFQEFYDHSQWSIPQSPRIMGDGELYQYAGYRLLQGDHPFGVNPEVPPVGKYLNAASIGLFNNAFIFNLPLYLLALFLLHQLAKKLAFTKNESLLAILLFATSPLFFSQIGDTALDLFHVVTLLLYLVSLMNLVSDAKTKGVWWAIATGLSLGLFVGTKFGLFALAILVPLIWLLYQQKSLINLIAVFGTAGLLYLGSYGQYFWQGHSILEWVQTQKWIVNFYLHSQAVKNPLVFISAVITGISAWKEGWQTVAEWTLLWPLTVGSLILLSLNKKISQPTKIIYRVGLLLFGINLIVPFAVRYLLLILPLGIIALIILFRRLPKLLVSVLTAAFLIQSFVYVVSSPSREIARLNQLLSAHRFDDLYFETTKLASPQPGEGGTVSTWQDFSFPIHRFMHEIKVNSAKFTISQTTLISKNLLFSVTYQTPIGEVSFQQPGLLTNIQGKWKLVWDWAYIAPHFNPTATIIYRQGEQLGGTLTSSDGKNISKGSNLPFITVIPQNITNEPELLTDIKKLTGVDSLATRNMIHVDHPYTLNRRIGFVVPAYDKNIYTKLATNTAVLITQENAPESRIYPQGAIDRKFVPMIRELEKAHPELTGFIQGAIDILENGQLYRIYSAPATVPVDVTLPRSVDLLLGTDAQIVF